MNAKLVTKSKLNPLCLCGITIVFLMCFLFKAEGRANDMIFKGRDSGYFTLGLIGFNYTDRRIEEYFVDGSGGGHVHLSSPTSGGSGTMCCARISKKLKDKILVTVKWQVDGCTYIVKSPTGSTGKRRKFNYKETHVYLSPPTGNDPAYLETHFYPDGRVKVQVTDSISLPEIQLDKDRKDSSRFPRCENDPE